MAGQLIKRYSFKTMISIDNNKIRKCSIRPVWAFFPGFSLLFKNPGNCHVNFNKYFDKLWCNHKLSDKSKLYNMFEDFLSRIGIEYLYKKYSFCPLSPNTYHVTAWDGVNSANLDLADKNNKDKFSKLFKDIPNSLLLNRKLFDILMQSSLVLDNWNIGFKFRKLTIWNDKVLVAVLEPIDEASDKLLNILIDERNKLNSEFEKNYNVKMTNMFVPHVSLAYFADFKFGKLAKRELSFFNEKIYDYINNVTLKFSNVNFYAFTDMGNFFTFKNHLLNLE